MGAFTKLFSRLRITSDPNVSTQTSAVITADSGNTNLVIAPSGTGAIVASIPDGTATGGNARGANAVDFQRSRTAGSQVASGTESVIIGGRVSTASGLYSIAGGSFANATGESSIALGSTATASGFGGIALGGINGGGNGPTASGNYSIAVGMGNTASSNWSVVLGGNSNTASTNTHATVVGGNANTSSGQHSVSGGTGNTSSGSGSVCFGSQSQAIQTNAFANGFQCGANGVYSTAFGYRTGATGAYSYAIGRNSNAYLFGQFAIASDGFQALPIIGDSQQSLLTAWRQATLTTGGITTLSLDGTGTTSLIIPNGNNRMWNVTIKYVAVVTTITGTATGVTVGDTKSQNIEIGFKKVGGVSSLVGGGSFSIPQEDASMGSASLIPTAGGSQELALTFTAPTFAGGGSVTCRVVAKVELVEVAY